MSSLCSSYCSCWTNLKNLGLCRCGGVSCEEGWWGGWSICEDPRQAGERDQGGGEISSRERDQKAWDDEKMKLEAEVKRLKLSVLGAEKKLNAKQVELDEAFAAKNATAEEAASEIDGLQ